MTDELGQRLQQLQEEYYRLSLNNLTQATKVADEAMALTVGAGPAHRALALRIHANNLRNRGSLGVALTVVTQAQQLFREAGDEVEWARTINATIPILVGLDRNREAVKAAHTALNLLLRNGERAAAGRMLNNMGAMYGNMGQPRQALECLLRGEELARETGLHDFVARNQSNRVLVLQQLGRHRESLSVCARALRYYLRHGAKVPMARVLQSGAIGLFHLGRFGKALRRFSRARSLFEALSSARDVAVCDLYIAACYLELNRFDQTIARTRRVIQVLDPVEHGFQHAWAHLYEGVALSRSGQPEEARRLLTRAYRWFEERGHSAWAGRAHLEEAELLLAMGSATEASRTALKAARLFAVAHMETEEARAHLLRAEASLAAGKLKVAEVAVDAAYPRFQRAHMPGPTFRALHVKGRIAMERGDWEPARRYLSRAVETAERMRSTVQVSFRRAFLDDKSSAYADLVWTLLVQGRVRSAHRLVDLAKSRALVDELAAVPGYRKGQMDAGDQELLSQIERIRREYQELTAPIQLGPEQAIALRGAGAMSIPAQRAQLEARLAALWDEWELRHLDRLGSGKRDGHGMAPAHRKLPSGAAMVEYFAAGARLMAFVSDNRGLRGWVDLGTPERVRRSLELLQLNLDTAAMMAARGRREVPALTKNARSLLQELHQALWEPLLPLLGDRRSAVVIPHGILHLVPFEALHDGKTYLVQQMELGLAPSRAVWLLCQTRGEQRSATGPDLVVGFNPAGALPYVDTEARLIAGALGTSANVGPNATLDRITTPGHHRVVHLAAHGEFRLDNPHFSTLLLADGPLTVADVARLRLDSSLVVLSGCETGISQVTRGEELMGMISAFLQAGSASVLASRWRVDDQVTTDLMDRFYAGLLAGESKAAALRNAQAPLAEQNLHPLYWAAFGLIGHSGALM
ncbi:MAG TPA: CHAT domain-containing tetratricopeptide repeat protein [Symbiobacteriaceae bacterium]|nr:CHAT domain-containing tetratricopeptide repeat protein [Symbiobacteriaceae bacterium]